MAGNNSVVGLETITFTDNMSFDGTERGGAMTTNGQLWIGSTPARHVRLGNITSSDNSILVGNNPGNIDLRSNPAVVPDLHTAKWIVNSTPLAGGNQTSITAAIAAASPGDTIFIMPGATGTYTENITLPANINLVAMQGDQNTPHVTIIGTVTMTAAGTSSISNIRLQTNGSFAVAVTGSAASILNLNNCTINCTNNTGISFTSSSASALINLRDCQLDKTTTGIAYYASSSAGTLLFSFCMGGNTGSSTTASTISAGSVVYEICNLPDPVTTSGTANYSARNSTLSAGLNTTSLTHGGSAASSSAIGCTYVSGTASAISIGAAATLGLFGECVVGSTNANAITGAGILNYTPISFNSTSSTINTSTQNRLADGPIIFSPGGITIDNTNVLDNYSFSTWTPTLVGGTVAGTTTYTVQAGHYTRVGNIITIWGNVQGSAATGTGNAVLGGFPFTIKNQANFAPIGPILLSAATWAWPAGTTSPTVQGMQNTLTALIVVSGTAVAAANLQMTNGAFAFEFSLTYQI